MDKQVLNVHLVIGGCGNRVKRLRGKKTQGHAGSDFTWQAMWLTYVVSREG